MEEGGPLKGERERNKQTKKKGGEKGRKWKGYDPLRRGERLEARRSKAAYT